MRFATIHIVLLLLPMIFIGSLGASDTRQIELVIDDTVKICEDKRDFVILVKSGPVDIDDNFVGFELSLKYDSSKLMIYPNLLTNGTISGRLSYDADYFNIRKFPADDGSAMTTLLAEGMHIYGPVPGPKDNPYLVAMQGKYIGPDNCDIQDIDISWEYIYFPEYKGQPAFKNEVIETVDNSVSLTSGIDTDKTFSLEVLPETAVYDSVENVECEMRIGMNYSTGKIRAVIENSNPGSFDITGIEEIDNQYVHITDFDKSVEGMNQICEVEFLVDTLYSGYQAFDIKVKTNNNVTDSTNLSVTLYDMSSCECINSFTSEDIKIKNIIPVHQSIVESEIDRRIEETFETVSIKTLPDISKVRVTDIEGIAIRELPNNGNDILIEKSNLASGTYFIVLQYVDGRIESRKIIINN